MRRKGGRGEIDSYPNQRECDENERVLKRPDEWLGQGMRANGSSHK